MKKIESLLKIARWNFCFETYAAFTLNGFDDQERNLTFVKTDFQVLKLKYKACNFKQAFYSLYKLYISWPWQHKNDFIQAFLLVPGCQNCMCKRGIRNPFSQTSGFVFYCQNRLVSTRHKAQVGYIKDLSVFCWACGDILFS